MATLHESDFDRAAGRAVDAFLTGGSKLADAVAQEAIGGGMNPDQIQRLVQAANTMAFLRMMQERQQQGAGDLMHEFDPTDARQIIQMIIGAEDVPHHGAPDVGAFHGGVGGTPDELPDEMSAMRAGPGGPGEGPPEPPGLPSKDDADEGDGDKKTPKKEKDDGADAEKRDAKSKAKTEKEAIAREGRLRKLAGVLEDQFLQAELSFEERYAALRDRFRLAHGSLDFAAFEKDALAEHGDAYGIAVLDAMRVERGLSPLGASSQEKIAALADRHVSDDTEELRLFADLVKIAESADRLRRGRDYMRARCA